MTLTKRQSQVAALARYGASIKEIATVLGVEENTVKGHKKVVAVMERRLNRDLFGMPLTRDERIAEFQKIVARVNNRFESEPQNDA